MNLAALAELKLLQPTLLATRAMGVGCQQGVA